MNLDAQLSDAFHQLNQDVQHTLRFFYGKVEHVDKNKDTCLVSVQEERLQTEVNLRVGQQPLQSSFITYPKPGSQVLFVSEDHTFARAYMLACSEIEAIHLSADTTIDIRAGENSLGKLLSDLITAIKGLTVTTSDGILGVSSSIAVGTLSTQLDVVQNDLNSLLKTD